ncbi:hypothetical protein [Amorphus sp. MBR-141]|jgi:hypothetical protein
MTRIAVSTLSACILLFSIAGAEAQQHKNTESGGTPAAEENNLPSIAEEAEISGEGEGTAPGSLDGEEKVMDEMDDSEDQDGCSGTNDDPGVCDGQLLD